MNNVTNTFVVTAIASLVSGVVYAGGGGHGGHGEYDTQYYHTENASIRVFGGKCDTLSERRLYASLVLKYKLGPNAGRWESSFFSGDDDDDTDMDPWEDDGPGCETVASTSEWESEDGCGGGGMGHYSDGPFTAQDEMTDVYLAHNWYTYEDLEYNLKHFGLYNCDDFEYESFLYGETEVDEFHARINKRRNTASVRMRGWAFWEDFSSERVRKIYFDLRARMDQED